MGCFSEKKNVMTFLFKKTKRKIYFWRGLHQQQGSRKSGQRKGEGWEWNLGPLHDCCLCSCCPDIPDENLLPSTSMMKMKQLWTPQQDSNHWSWTQLTELKIRVHGWGPQYLQDWVEEWTKTTPGECERLVSLYRWCLKMSLPGSIKYISHYYTSGSYGWLYVGCYQHLVKAPSDSLRKVSLILPAK